MVRLPTLVALVLLNAFYASAFFDNSSLVLTKYGAVRGFQFDLGLGDGSEADIFLGIPYAKPPVANLRFEKPVKPNPWFGIKDATKWALGCPPSSLGTANISTNSEDCLYLNIFRPSKLHPRPPRKGYPVIVWVHGGSNVVGSAPQFGYKNLSINFVPQGVIVVSIQYRLGPFGFATTGDSVMPGNLGLWDITQAAKFLGEVIGQFGGNPKKIHLWGLSSSSIAISGIALSPHARDHFHGTVLQSGSAFNRGINNEGIQFTTELARQLGCDTSTSASIKACFKAKTFQQFWDALSVTGLTRLNPTNIASAKYEARIDGDFFPHNFSELYKTAPPKPSYIGAGSAEAALYSVFGNLFSPFTPFVIQKANWPTFGESNFTSFIRNAVIDQAYYGPLAVNASQDIIDFYSSDKTNTSDYVYWIRKYTQLLSDIIFHIPLVIEAREKVNNNWPTYMYINEHFSRYLYDQIDLNPPLRGSFHTNEYPYQFGFFNLGIVFPMDAPERAFQKALVETIGNFVKNGNPSTPYLTWQPLSSSQPAGYARLNATSSFDNGPLFADRLAFWDSIRNGKYPFDPLLRVNFQNITAYACDISTNYVC